MCDESSGNLCKVDASRVGMTEYGPCTEQKKCSNGLQCVAPLDPPPSNKFLQTTTDFLGRCLSQRSLDEEREQILCIETCRSVCVVDDAAPRIDQCACVDEQLSCLSDMGCVKSRMLRKLAEQCTADGYPATTKNKTALASAPFAILSASAPLSPRSWSLFICSLLGATVIAVGAAETQ